jgi:hypothetical protein
MHADLRDDLLRLHHLLDHRYFPVVNARALSRSQDRFLESRFAIRWQASEAFGWERCSCSTTRRLLWIRRHLICPQRRDSKPNDYALAGSQARLRDALDASSSSSIIFWSSSGLSDIPVRCSGGRPKVKIQKFWSSPGLFARDKALQFAIDLGCKKNSG